MSLTSILRDRKYFYILLIGLLFLGLGCQDGATDKLRQARVALGDKNADLAETRLQEALKADPGLLEARRLMADVHIERHKYQEAEDALATLWTERKFDGEQSQLTTDDRRLRHLIEEQREVLYRRWLDHIDAKKEPEQFEKVIRKGLERDPRSVRLNTLLVDFYEARAEQLIEQGNKLEAAQQLEKITTLRTLPQRRQEATTRSQNLRREAFVEDAKKRFEAEHKPKLIEAELYHAEKNAVLVRVEQDIDRRLMPNREQDTEQAKALAYRALAPRIAQTLVEIGGVDEEADLGRLVASVQGADIVDENFVRGTYSLVGVLPVDSIIEVAFQFHETKRLAEADKDKAAKDAPAKDAPAKAEEQDKEQDKEQDEVATE